MSGMLVAHRGFRSPKGENRMVDFENALKTCKAVEFDIRFTKDQKIIIFHDDDFKRIGGVHKTVRQLTYEEIKQVPFFSQNPEYLPPLFIEDYVNKLASQYKMINVEIKADTFTVEEFKMLEDALLVLRSKTKAEIAVSSFDLNVLKFIAKLDGTKFKKAYLIEHFHDLDKTLIKEFDYINPSVKMVLDILHKDFFKKLNLPMNIWTFKQQSEVDAVKAHYPTLVYGWISDNPDLVV